MENTIKLSYVNRTRTLDIASMDTTTVSYVVDRIRPLLRTVKHATIRAQLTELCAITATLNRPLVILRLNRRGVIALYRLVVLASTMVSADILDTLNRVVRIKNGRDANDELVDVYEYEELNALHAFALHLSYFIDSARPLVIRETRAPMLRTVQNT